MRKQSVLNTHSGNRNSAAARYTATRRNGEFATTPCTGCAARECAERMMKMYDWYFGKHRTPSDLQEAEMQVLLGIGGIALGFIAVALIGGLWLGGVI